MSTIAGGDDNHATDSFSVVAGGMDNISSGKYGSVGGGANYTASGLYSTVPGGLANKASANYAFASGRRAKSTHAGTFVWGDSTNSDLASTAANQFIVRSSGGMWLGTTSSPSFTAGRFINTSTGAYLTTGGTWTNSSDRNLKENLEEVDGSSILDKVESLPIYEWNYKTESDDVRHIGPTAQDFRETFGVGNDSISISTIDPAGISLAAIKELTTQNKKLTAENKKLEDRLARLEALVSRSLPKKRNN
jgi:hypothetical protein